MKELNMINVKELIEKVTLKGFYDTQENIAIETQKMIDSIRVNGKPLDRLKKEVKH